ncbi:atp-dependent dna helicase [Fusarium albosuccineum]|uniref:Atp-dependent dna helicase n=1 Tax=Fusarium albosuccineum TaxID=1237068 RepID=A0A8H4KEC9_9HYPO|nr:atp-dependent dna helicase [Fusarium albosuccineum]
MEKLPPEILPNIVSHIYDDISSNSGESNRRFALAPLACISRRWQHPVESHSFRDLQLTPTRLRQAETKKTADGLWNTVVVGYSRTPNQPYAPSSTVREIPEMPMVSEFTVDFDLFNLVFEPCSMNQLARKMTRLQKIDWCLSDNENRPRARQELRKNFADTLNLIARSVKFFSLRYLREAPYPHWFSPPRESIIPPGTDCDVLSQALHHFTQRDGLLEVLIHGSFDETIIWPGAQRTLPRWPTLQKLYVDFHHILPSGEWLVKSVVIPFDSRFRTERIQAITNRLLLAAGQGACHMPEMKWMGIGIDLAPVLLTDGTNRTCGRLDHVNGLEIEEEVLGAWEQAMRTRGITFDQCTFTETLNGLPDFEMCHSELGW